MIKIFFAWLRARWGILLYICAVFGIFMMVYSLYGHPWDVAGYAVLLCIVLGAFASIWDIYRFRKKHKQLTQIIGRFPTAPLPDADSALEQDYTEIIAALDEERDRLERESESMRWDAEEYYTLWAHQIKTPMAAMRLLLQSDVDGLNRQSKADIEQELFRIGQYVDMVLQYQRLATLQSDVILQRFSLEALAKKAAKDCAPLFIHKKIALSIEEMPYQVVTDEKWFCFVLEQLYTNAVKYTAKGAVHIFMTDAKTLIVEDTGIGIPAEDLPRVFERGFTGAIGRSERSSTGIGLYLCKTILGRLGFGISISSEQGKGTRVFLHLHQEKIEVE